MTTLLIILIVLAFISGAELFGVMIAAAALGAFTASRGFTVEFDGMIVSMFGGATDDKAIVLSTIPMFIYAGYLLAEAKTADRLVRFANALLGWLPGGLAIVTIGTCALFTTFTGASGVTIVALGGVLMPALVRNGYPKKFSMGMLAGTGSVGLLFPPALPLFVYGTVYGLTQVSDPAAAALWDTRRFLFAGIVPGILTITLLSMVAVWVARKLPRQKFEMGELGRSFLAALPELFIPFGVILGLASGFALPEIAALTVVYVIILEVVILRMLKPIVLWSVSREAMAMVGAIFIIILASTAFTNYLVTADVPKMLVEWTREHVESKILFLLALNLLLLFVGMIMDIFSAIVIVLPLITPIAKHYGIDPYHLGVIFLLNLEVGYLTPPVGLNLFITSIKFQTPVVEVMRATIPFMITLLIALAIVTYVPALTVVPEAERTGPVRTLTAMIQTGMEEAKVSVPEITLVDATGALLKDAKGQSIVRKFIDCNTITDEIQRGSCQALFFDVTDCVPTKGAARDAKQTECANNAIAAWAVKELNGDLNDLEKAVITISEVALVDSAGDPVKAANGTPIVKRIATCGPLTGTERDTCRSLFVEASSCQIQPHDVTECVTGGKDAVTCRKAAIDMCIQDKTVSWVEEYPEAAAAE
ncbi:MAG: TRAP transporter large permease [Deltaproteobacteria bacterium]|nr:TRAP transporter large permease [Deltaproteobacteria bacterium]MDQ3299650.1 TRAP transporter large permease [Myxococcota bacterium]